MSYESFESKQNSGKGFRAIYQAVDILVVQRAVRVTNVRVTDITIIIHIIKHSTWACDDTTRCKSFGRVSRGLHENTVINIHRQESQDDPSENTNVSIHRQESQEDPSENTIINIHRQECTMCSDKHTLLVITCTIHSFRK